MPAAPAPSRSLDPVDCGRAEQGQPQAAVGAEALLRGEVVDVRLRRVDRQPAGPRRSVDQHQRVVGVRRALDRRPSPRSRSRCGPGERVGGRLGATARARRRAPPRSRSGRPGTARLRSPWRTWTRTPRRSGAGPAPRSARPRQRPRTPSYRRCRAPPRSRRAPRTARRSRRGPGRPGPLTGRLPMRGADQHARVGKRRERLGADLRGSASEPPVGGPQFLRKACRGWVHGRRRSG